MRACVGVCVCVNETGFEKTSIHNFKYLKVPICLVKWSIVIFTVLSQLQALIQWCRVEGGGSENKVVGKHFVKTENYQMPSIRNN